MTIFGDVGEGSKQAFLVSSCAGHQSQWNESSIYQSKAQLNPLHKPLVSLIKPIIKGYLIQKV